MSSFRLEYCVSLVANCQLMTGHIAIHVQLGYVNLTDTSALHYVLSATIFYDMDLESDLSLCCGRVGPVIVI